MCNIKRDDMLTYRDTSIDNQNGLNFKKYKELVYIIQTNALSCLIY